MLFDKFVDAFKNNPLDRVFITDIYQVASRESVAITKKVSSQKLVAAIAKDTVEYVAQDAISDQLKLEAKSGDIVLVMGAGNIYSLSKQLTGKK